MYKIIIGILCMLLSLGGQAQRLQGFEYAFDTDPGIGNATYVALSTVQSIDSTFHFNTGTLAVGSHTMIIRFKDTANRWSTNQYSSFFLTQGSSNYAQPNISAFEYYLDSVNTTHYTYALPANTVAYDNTAKLTFPGAGVGLHTLYIRTTSNNNLKSMYVAKPLFITNGSGNAILGNITALEYKLDTASTWNSVAVSPSASSIQDTLHLNLANASLGLHTLYTRVRNNADLTSHIQYRSFIVMNGSSSDSVQAIEVFFDTDPGFGQGVVVSMNPTKIADTTLSVTVPTGLSNGNHIMYVRAKDNTGNWSHYKHDTIKICQTLPPIAGFDKVRYGSSFSFVDTSKHAATYLWNFGDGTTSTEALPIHTYSSFGNFVVTQNVMNTCNADIAIDTLVVEGVESYSPKIADNDADFVMTIYGGGLDTSVVTYIQSGSTTIYPIKKYTKNQGTALTCLYDFHTTSIGFYDVHINVNASSQFTFTNGLEIKTRDTLPLVAQIVAPTRVRTGVWNNATIKIPNNNNHLKNGVITVIAVPDGIVTNLDSLLYQPTLDVAYKYYSRDSALTIQVPFDTIKMFADSLISIKIDTFIGKPFAGKIYEIYIPFILSHSTFTYPFRFKSSSNGNKSIKAICHNFTLFGSPWTDEELGHVNDMGMAAAGAIGAIPHPAAQAISKFADEINYGSKIFFAEGCDWYYGTNVANADFYKELATSYTVDKASAWAVGKIGENLPSAATKDVTIYKKFNEEFYENAITLSGRPRTYNQLIGDLTSLHELHLDLIGDNNYAADIAFQYLKSRYSGMLNSHIAEYCSNLLPKYANESSISSVTSFDPNEIYGPRGYTEAQYIRQNSLSNFSIAFENVDTALAPAQIVNIYDTIDADRYNLSTFQFGDFQVGDSFVVVPAFRHQYATTVDISANTHVKVRVNMQFDTATGIAHWQFISLDTASNNFITDPDLGFLLPNVTSPNGEGKVYYSIELKGGLSHEDTLMSVAHIYFDENAPIVTNTWKNVIENQAPVSFAYAAQRSDSTLWIHLTGSDAHSGIAHYQLYGSKNGGAYEYIAEISDDTLVVGGIIGDKYDFYCTAEDKVGNKESKTPRAEATVLMQPVGVNDTKLTNSNVYCYPNPAKDKLYIKYTDNLSVSEIELHDIFGRTVKVFGKYQKVLNVSGLSSGVYFINIQTSEGVYNEKIIIE